MRSRGLELIAFPAVGAMLIASSMADQAVVPPTVGTVNGQAGTVVIPTVQRQVSAALDISSGSVSWNFPTPFINQPTCWETIAQTDTTRVFSAPVTTAISQLSVTVNLRSATQVINLAGLGAVTIWTNPPAGTTVALSCVGALP